MKLQQGLRVLIPGKERSGKNSMIALLARMLSDLDYKEILIDGDASNLNGLCRLSRGMAERLLNARKVLHCAEIDFFKT